MNQHPENSLEMAGPTPRTDVQVSHPHNLCLENSRAEYGGRNEEVIDQVVPADFARQLERELAEAHKLAKEYAKEAGSLAAQLDASKQREAALAAALNRRIEWEGEVSESAESEHFRREAKEINEQCRAALAHHESTPKPANAANDAGRST